MDWKTIVLIIALLVNIGLAFLSYFKSKRGKVNLVWAIVISTVVFWIFSMIFYRQAGPESSLFWCKILYLSASLIPISFLYFIFLYPTGEWRIKRWLKVLIVLPTVLLIFMIIFPEIIITKVIARPGQEKEIIWGPLYFLYVLYISSYFIWALGNLFRKYLKSQGILKAQTRYMFWGTTISIVFGSTFNLFLPTIGYFHLNWFGQVTTLFMVGFISYAIVHYRLMDIQIVVGRTFIYILSFVTILVFAFLLMFLNGYLAQPLSLNIAGPLIIIISLLLFQPLFRFYEKFASKYFYYVFYSYSQVLADLGRNLTRILDLEKLSSLLINTLRETMKLDRAVILLREADENYKILKNIGFREENGISLVRDNFLTQYLEKTQKPLVYEELALIIRDTQEEKEKEKLEKLRGNMKRIEANLCLPLLIEDKIIGLIVLGNKLSGDAYSQQDVELLTALASQSSIALQNAILYAQVQDLSLNLQQKVREQTKSIRELLEMKSEFLKVVGHQLNTPVSIIKSMLSMMVEGSVKGEKLQEFIKKSYLSSERLYTILSDILTAQGLIGGEEPVNLSLCQIEEIIEKQVGHFKIQAEMKGLKITLKKPKEPLPTTLADSEMIERIISRLIDNAILYTPPLAKQDAGQAEKGGEIEVSIDSKKEDSQDFIVITVKDSGIGLTEEEKKKLFNLFYRGERATGLHPNGSGLGLFIVKNLIEIHKGKIEIQSEGKGKGSTFVITLPVITEV